MDLAVGCKLRYTLPTPTGFVLQIEAAKADGQLVSNEALIMPGGESNPYYSVYTSPVTRTRVVRTVLGPGAVEIYYEARVSFDGTGVDPSRVEEFDFINLPMEYLEYLSPSRYCASDIFTSFAYETFGKMPRGHGRVTAVSDWIHGNIAYKAGSTGPNSTSADVFKTKAGVCRDFAHLGISLCRALGIPARYASVYANALNPQDFHAVFQAYLSGPNGGAWYSFDPTHMSSVDAIARIAAGRDAADVAFAWPQGQVTSEPPIVWANAPGRAQALQTSLAVGRP
jgi:transglutaminase-like putative cysteine protease